MAFYNRGLAYFYKREFEKAVEDYDQAIRLNPNYAMAIFNRGQAKLKMGDKASAEQDMAQAKQINPKVADEALNPTR